MRRSTLITALALCMAGSLPATQSLHAQQYPKRELRAAWIATVMNIDWPSRKGLPPQAQRQEYVALLDRLHELGMNAVIVQVRPTADAFYPSSYEPWSEYLTGRQGESPLPYYNPLAFMIEEARARGIEFHAWFNPYRVSMNTEFSPAAGHPFLQHKDWFVEYGGKWYYDPGHPEAREFVLGSIMETVRHYDLDAVHFDDYFYPYRIAGKEFPDDSTYHCYGAAQFASREDWRRDNVDFFVRELSARIAREKPHVKFGISPFGVWRNRDKDERGSDTQAGQTNYDDLFADVLKWLQEGWIDYVTPQLYWHIGFEKAEYKTLVKWWNENSHGRHLYIGQGVYRVGEKGWEDPGEMSNQVAFNRTFPSTHGSMYFSSKIFMQNKKGINRTIDSLYRFPALVPAMPWKQSVPMPPPRLTRAEGSPVRGLTLNWADSVVSPAAYYVIYRFPGATMQSLDDPQFIVAVVPRPADGRLTWTDTTARKRTLYTYTVTAADRLHNESANAPGLTVRTRGNRKVITVSAAPANPGNLTLSRHVEQQ